MAAGTLSRASVIWPRARIQDLILPVGIIASVLVILIPLPAALLDVLLSVNITIAVIMLLTTIYVRTPLEFSVFPSLLLATTLLRLVLNVATTRLILTHAGTSQTMAAGGVIQAFAEFVAGDSIVVGMIIFVIIVVIQFVVITKGATRISEVAARFALDGMPGRQMAIDADLNAGIIDEREAQRRRKEITEQADFFGAMDGASKFVRGDAIAGIVITLINVVGGLFIGVIQDGMDLASAASVFTRLTIGDGLVTQVPAFLISLAAGLLVTRSSNESDLPKEFFKQLFSRPETMAVAGGFLGILIFTNLPKVPLLMIAGSCFGAALMMTKQSGKAKAAAAAKQQAEKAKPAEERVEDYLAIDPMEVELGVALVRLADPKRGGDLLDRIHRIRQNVAGDIGIILPKVRIRDSFQLEQNQYRFKIAGTPVVTGTLPPNMLLAIDSGMTTGKIQGIPTRDPVLGSPALWIEPARRDKAEMHGYTVVEPAQVIATHFTDTVSKHADELLTRDATKHLLDELKKTSPAVIDELIPGLMKLADVQQVLQMLLREQVPIRQLGVILEALGDCAARIKDPISLSERVRARLARVICAKYRDREGRLFVATLDPAMEDRIRAGFEHNDRGLFIRMSPQAVEKTCRSIATEVEKLVRANHPPILLVSPQIRAALKEMTLPHLPKLIVLSYNEVTRDTRIESVGMAAEPR